MVNPSDLVFLWPNYLNSQLLLPKIEDSCPLSQTLCSCLKSLGKKSGCLLDQYISHCFDSFPSIVARLNRMISARVRIIRDTTSAEPNPGITRPAIILLISNNTDSCLWITPITRPDVEPFSIAVPLQRCLSTNEGLPCVPTQRRWTVATVSDQREKRIGGHVKNHEVQLLAKSHSEAHFVKWCTPVGRQFSF